MVRFLSVQCWLLVIVSMVGCAENSMLTDRRTKTLLDEQLAVSRQNQELQNRANAADEANQRVQTELAQQQQRTKILEERLGLLTEQLSSTNAQLARVRQEKESASQQVQTLTASVHRQRGAVIEPNNSLLANMPRIDHSAVTVARDGDVIRIAIPEPVLFQPGTVQLRVDADGLLDQLAAELNRTFPGHMVGIEGHTQRLGAHGSDWQNASRLSVGQAIAVQDVLLVRGQLQPNRLFVVGHGGNHPVVSNASTAGQQANRRIEVVIYPDRVR